MTVYEHGALDGWRPIVSAPEDGTMLRLRGTYPNRHAEMPTVEVHGFYESGGYTEGFVDQRFNTFYATHWKPLNEPRS